MVSYLRHLSMGVVCGFHHPDNAANEAQNQRE
jgi:hypothetical protein